MTTKEKMLHALISRISQTGFHHLKMDDFIQSMPTSRATVYRYFPSRTAILTAVTDEYISYVDSLAVPSNFDHIDNWLTAFQDQLSQAIVFNSYVSQRFLDDLIIELPTPAAQLQTAITEYTQKNTNFYLAGQQAGVFNPLNLTVWLIQDQLVLPHLIDPNYLFTHDLTLKSALEGYAEIKANDILNFELRAKFDTAFLLPVISKISQSS